MTGKEAVSRKDPRSGVARNGNFRIGDLVSLEVPDFEMSRCDYSASAGQAGCRYRLSDDLGKVDTFDRGDGTSSGAAAALGKGVIRGTFETILQQVIEPRDLTFGGRTAGTTLQT